MLVVVQEREGAYLRTVPWIDPPLCESPSTAAGEGNLLNHVQKDMITHIRGEDFDITYRNPKVSSTIVIWDETLTGD